MEGQEYEMLVWSLQGNAQDRPRLFRIKVILISLFAYFMLFLVLGILALYLFAMFNIAQERAMFKIYFASSLLIIGPILWLTLRTFFKSIPAPEERELKAGEVPELFKTLSELRNRLKGEPIHHVLVTNEFNAAIVQHPRFGLFGGYRNYLFVGLPMMYALPPEEFKAVLAHEYGHIAGGHGKVGRWIYRQRRTFHALYAHVWERRESNMANGAIAAMLNRFYPYYSAYTFVLSRQNEYEADAISGGMCGAEVSASSLVRADLQAKWMDEAFWPKIYKQAAQHETPPMLPYVSMRKMLALMMPEWATKERLKEVMKVESDVHDTHPCLSERVAALDQPARLPSPARVFAADALLGKVAQQLTKEFDEKWWRENKDQWQKHNHRAIRSQQRIDELEQRELATLSISEAQELALLLAEFRSMSAAKNVLADLLGRPGERYPKPVYYYGRALLDEGDAKGLEYLEEACRLSPAMGGDCAGAGYHWLVDKQGEAAAEAWLARLEAVHSR